MKFLVLFCLIFIFPCSIASVLSYTSRQNRLAELLRKTPWERNSQSSILSIGKNRARFNEQIHSTEYGDAMRIRNTWDSGEDYYFQWANQHRRPVEYLAGRKRDTSKVVLPPRDRRINGGLWRSGLVG